MGIESSVSRFEKFAVANIYAVNGTSRPYFDHALRRFPGDRHALKRRFQRMVLAHAAKLSPIMLADTHPGLRTEEPHARARAEFRDLVESARLVDVYRHLHPKAKRLQLVQSPMPNA